MADEQDSGVSIQPAIARGLLSGQQGQRKIWELTTVVEGKEPSAWQYQLSAPNQYF